jgi:ATP-dependent DNA ligase
MMAKRRDSSYQSGEPTGMQKIKRQRTAACVVGGFRYLASKPLVGSLLLGRFNSHGKLDHVGFASSIQQQERMQLTKRLTRMIKAPGFTGKDPGGQAAGAGSG